MAKIIDLSGKPMNGSKPHVRAGKSVVFSVPGLPDDPAGLDRVANDIEDMGVTTPADAFTVAILRSVARCLRRIEALEKPHA